MKLPKLAYISQSQDEEPVRSYLSSVDVEIKNVSAKQIIRNKVKIEEGAFVCGNIPTVHAALKQLGKGIPKPNDYPEELRDFLLRKVWRGQLRHLLRYSPVFVKPYEKLKRFTGKVVYQEEDYWLHGISKRLEVWFSERVKFGSEYRIYVLRGEIIGIHSFENSDIEELDLQVVKDAVRTMGAVALGFDFGVLEDGRTALIEVNDAYSIGNYGLNDKDYTEFLLQRWDELTD